MRNFAIFVLGLIVFSAVTATDSMAQSSQFPRVSGATCQPTMPAYSSWIRGNSGIGNTSTTSAIGVVCAIPIEGTSLSSATTTVNSLRIYYLDQNGTNGKAISCGGYLIDEAGAWINFATKFSCSTAGGCTSNANTYQGSGYIEFSSPTSLTNAHQLVASCALVDASTGAPSYIRSLKAWLTVM